MRAVCVLGVAAWACCRPDAAHWMEPPVTGCWIPWHMVKGSWEGSLMLFVGRWLGGAISLTAGFLIEQLTVESVLHSHLTGQLVHHQLWFCCWLWGASSAFIKFTSVSTIKLVWPGHDCAFCEFVYRHFNSMQRLGYIRGRCDASPLEMFSGLAYTSTLYQSSSAFSCSASRG